MKNLKFLGIAFLCLGIAACDESVETPNGRIPSEFLPLVQQYMGKFHGQIRRIPNEIAMTLDGDKVVLNTASDLIAPVCESKVGELKKISYKKKDGAIEITSAEFAFDANLCTTDFLGTRLDLYFTNQNSFEISMLERYEYDYNCRNIGGHPMPPPPSPYPPYCRAEYFPVYLNGKFTR